MKVLVIGGGGREHALAWKAARSDLVEMVFVAPGNAGTAHEQKVENISIDSSDINRLFAFSKDKGIELAIVGPEAPLVEGITDVFNRGGVHCFGPTAGAARLEGSKVFCKDFLARHRIPSATYETFTETAPAKAYIREHGAPIVVKADGLAAGKGVIVARTEDEAVAAVEAMLSKNAFGEAGRRVVIEECLIGEEASFIVMADGKNILPLATSQDHKARDNGDLGPNTGGMGAYSPAPVITPIVYDRIIKEVIEPTLRCMAEDGYPYTGFLYAGLMISADGTPKVLEYNCRFGDPETQPILLRLKSDLIEMCMAALEGRLDRIESQWDKRAALGVVMAAGGYPEAYRKGDVISGLPQEETEGTKVFHAGTRMENGRVVTSGGRVLCVTAMGDTVAQAQTRAYELVNKITWDNVCYRTDIGYRAVLREKS
ncbi:phosphoribosylglycinamide synthetase phosphoribosylamine-glycine ligase [uncultured Desulfobacterium sp.]|uniref:Phosphoribosylamine--glycine ligase n=1 Tax=uncultured Desulfobacterium sp. TaxID=201089 RepID=A0A445MZR5_9BACT|nr:phosphoribosylglycinamide synthetase phosphoribosylamine-glycine ligase [uncultured Desulfobacterium sp.]